MGYGVDRVGTRSAPVEAGAAVAGVRRSWLAGLRDHSGPGRNGAGTLVVALGVGRSQRSEPRHRPPSVCLDRGLPLPDIQTRTAGPTLAAAPPDNSSLYLSV